MPGETRLLDMCVGIAAIGLPCCPHNTVNLHTITLSTDVFDNILPVSRLFDMNVSTHPHVPLSMNIMASPTNLVNALGQHRLGDSIIEFAGIASSVTSSADVISD